MKNRVSTFFIFVTLLGIIFVWLFGIPFHPRENLYYIPQLNIYLKVLKPYMAKHGYVLLGSERELFNYDNIDYIKINKSEAEVIIIIDPDDHGVIYVDDRFKKTEFNSVHYDFNRINFRDTLFYIHNSNSNFSRYKLKENYIGIYLDGYLRSINIKSNLDQSSFVTLEPI